MNDKLSEAEFLEQYDSKHYLKPNTTVDVVIYSIIEGKLHVLLTLRTNHPFKGSWSLIGGFVDIGVDKDLEATALRQLRSKTGVKAPYLEQYGTIGNRSRDPRGWSISTIYFALLPYESMSFKKSLDQNKFCWHPIENGEIKGQLAFDHNQLIKGCTERLQNKVLYSSLPLYLLKQPFTLTELREVYETILEEPIEPKTFRRRMLSAGIFVETGKTVQSHSKKPAMLYRLKNKDPHYFRVMMSS